MNASIDETRKEPSRYLAKDGGFKKGNPGKPKGAANKVTKTLRESILEAGRLAGEGVKPGGGLVAYLHKVAVDSPQVFIPLIGKVLPMDVTSSDGSMRPVVALYMPDNKRDGDNTKVIEHAPAKAIEADTAEDGTPAQPEPAAASAEPVQSQTPSAPGTHD